MARKPAVTEQEADGVAKLHEAVRHLAAGMMPPRHGVGDARGAKRQAIAALADLSHTVERHVAIMERNYPMAAHGVFREMLTAYCAAMGGALFPRDPKPEEAENEV